LTHSGVSAKASSLNRYFEGARMSKISKISIMPLFLHVIFLVLLFSTSSRAAIEPKPPATVMVEEAKSAELSDTLTYPARIIPKVFSQILSETDGVVTKIKIPMGQRIAKGSSILIIQHTDPVYQFAPVAITSPISGVVSQIEVNEGTQVSRGQKLASVTDPTKIEIRIEVPAQDLGSITQGMKGSLLLSSSNVQTAIKVLGVSPFVDPATGTASCQIALEKDQKKMVTIIPGMLGEVTFKTHIRQGISISEEALVYQGKDPFARVYESGKLKLLPIKLGRFQGSRIEVLDGLKSGMKLVTRASRYVGAGDTIQVEKN
jgi:multidrug efflux pump subunit AcrA (membrane-fusion protein)